MPEGIFQMRGLVLLTALLVVSTGAAQTSTPTSNPTTGPTTQQLEDPLPVGAVHRLGESRFSPLESDDFSTIDFSPDGSRVLTAGYQPRIWDFVAGKVVGVFPPLAIRAEQAVYLNADQVLVAWHPETGQKVNLVVHNAHTGERIRNLECSETIPITEMHASPDGSRVVVVGQHISLIDVNDGILLTRLAETESPATPGVVSPPRNNCFTSRVQFTSDSKTVMVLDADLQTKFFDARSGVPSDALAFATRHGATLSGDGKTIAVLNDDTQVFDVATRQLIPLPKPLAGDLKLDRGTAISRPVWGRLGPTGTLAVALSAPQPRIFLWDTSVRPVPVPRCIFTRCTYTTSMVFSRDGSTLAVLRRGSRPELIDIKSQTAIGTPTTHLGDIAALDVSSDGTVVVANDQAGSLSAWNLPGGERIAFSDGAHYGIAATPGAVQLTPDGKSVLLGGLTGTFQTTDLQTLKTARRFARPKDVNAATGTPALINVATTISPDGQHYAEWMPGLDACIFDARTGSPIKTIPDHNTQAYLMRFSPDGQTLAIPAQDGLHLYPITGGNAVVKHRNGLRLSILARPRFSPDGLQVALVDVESLTLWDTTASDDQPSVTIPVFGTAEAEYDDLGALLAVGDFPRSDDGKNFEIRHPSVSIYDPQSARLIVQILNMPAPVEAMKFVPHHPWLLTAGADANITQWDILALLHDPKLADIQSSLLWDAMANNDPALAYRAGAELARRGRLEKLAKLLPAGVFTTGDPRLIRKWIQELSSPENQKRELAHKHLEGAGPAAIAAVRTALASHPGGELEERLNDIAGVIGAEDPAAPTDDSTTLRSSRVVRLLEWIDTPEARSEAARILGTAATSTTQPDGATK